MNTASAPESSRVGRSRLRTTQTGISGIEDSQPVIAVRRTDALGEATQQEMLFAGCPRRCQHADLVGAVLLDHLAQPIGGARQRGIPVGVLPLTVDLDPRGRHAIVGGEAKMAVAIAVGQPALVDVFIFARHGCA